MAAKRARELVRQKSVLRSSSLPGKLADCTSTNPEEAGKVNTLIMYIARHVDQFGTTSSHLTNCSSLICL